MDESAARTRIVIAGPHPLLRRGIRTLCTSEPDLEVAGEASDGGEAVGLISVANPEVLIAEVSLPDMTGFELTRRVRLRAPNLAVVLLGGEDDADAVFQAVKTGASAIVSRTAGEAELLDVVRRAARGEHVIDETLDRPAIASRVLSKFTALNDETPQEMQPLFAPLSPREIEVLDLICRGNSNKQIARVLTISDQTVKNHITSILKKLAVNDRTEAVVFSLRQGWISMETS
ncbi:MAG: two-component system, NarL family, nitrate/nitrite response regulator NarL [Chloroflexota bacterium]|jgi:DNA-binding NarL/FixJ family response regulator|nr:two-component system, NarL family, nitrate/nitrite response regulator NarL [Chloroflexota bacterium]